jgi:hypothetical protein
MNTQCAALLLATLGITACGGGGGDAYGGGAGSPAPAASAPGAPTVVTSSGGISTVSSGLPNQRSMSISVEKYALDWSFDGDETKVTVRVTDTAGNPVPAGTRVQFSTSGGQILTTCSLAGVSGGDSAISACDVTFATQNYRPANGYVAIIAWLEGEEPYQDLNANGAYDTGEPFIDLGRIFRDDNVDGVYTPQVDELTVAGTLTAAPGIGQSACNVSPAVLVNWVPLSVPNTCDGVWGRTLIRSSVVLPVSDPRGLDAEFVAPTPAFPDASVRVWTNIFDSTGTVVNEVAAPSGTLVTVKTQPVGCQVAISPSAVPNVAVVPTFHTLSSTGACAGATVGIEVKFGDVTKLLNATLP